MKMNRSILVGIVAGASALAFTSCAYDPYYAGGYSGGYGDGYGYGGSGFSTSYFVSTGSSRWAYDPYAGAYYDYTRRSYYDPYLYGYYPVGYRPRYVHGAPHPHGWSRGSRYCPPPRTVRNHSLQNYHDRGERYRSLDRPWSDNVRVDTQGRDQRSGSGDRDRGGSRSDWTQGSSRDDRKSRPGSVSGGGVQRPSYDGRNSNQPRVLGDRSGGSDKRGYTPQRSGATQPEHRSRERDTDARSSRGGSFGGGPSPEAFSRPPQAGGNSDRSNRGVRSAPPMERRDERSGGRQASPAPERQAPQIERRESGGRDRGDSDRGKGKEIRGLGEG